jgi:hypothetical protein
MGTKFSTIYERAIFKFTDYNFLDRIPDYKEAILQKFLMSALVDFSHASSANLATYDLETEEFGDDLEDEIIEILSTGIAYHWLNGKTMSSELFRNTMHNSDYKTYSPANLLKEIKSLRDTMKKEYDGRINEYSFRKGLS